MRTLWILSLLLILQSCAAQNEKINGVSFVASPKEAQQKHVNPVVALNANYATVMPFGFIRSLDSPEVIFNTDRQWFGETKEGAKQYVSLLKKNKVKVMIKPQIWIWRGEYTGYLKMETEAQWKELEATYKKFILTYAELAKETNAEIFCIGTELEQFVAHRPAYWKALITEIKTIYKGKLTYAANWDEYKRTPFWTEMDFIGIDAYFPVCEDQTPSVDCALNGWQKWKGELSAFAKANTKKMLFTEFGYRSVDYTGKEPWKSDRSMTVVNLEGQANTTQALFESFWNEEWFAGGFVWKWFINHKEAGGPESSRFTPQNKPAEAIIRTYYGQE